MKVVALKLRDEDGHLSYLRQTIIDKDLGIIGDYPKREETKRIALLSERIRHLIDEEELEGLCLFRFCENITVRDLDAKKISIGQILYIGETVQIVTSIGKRCFEKCKLIQSGEECDLFTHVVFTRVIKGGFIKINDKVNTLDSNKISGHSRTIANK